MPHGPSFWFDTRIYLAVAAALLVIIVFYNPYVAVLGAILLAALYAYGHERHIQQQRALSSYLYSMTHNIEQGSSHALKNLPLVMIIVDRKGLLYWYNDVLTEWFDEEIKVGHSIFQLCPSLPLEKNWGKSGQEIFSENDRYYEIIYKPVEYANDEMELMIFYISDITACEKIKIRSQDAVPVMVYIQIDNYNDVLEGLSENQGSCVL